MDTGFWIMSGVCVAGFLVAVVVEHWMLACKRRREQGKTVESETGTPKPEVPE